MLYKRLEQGAYQWPHSKSEVKTLTPQQCRWLMEGLQIEQPKAHRPVTGLTTVYAAKHNWKPLKMLDFSCILWYNNYMENKEMQTSNTEEMVTIFRAEYERFLVRERAQA